MSPHVTSPIAYARSLTAELLVFFSSALSSFLCCLSSALVTRGSQPFVRVVGFPVVVPLRPLPPQSFLSDAIGGGCGSAVAPQSPIIHTHTDLLPPRASTPHTSISQCTHLPATRSISARIICTTQTGIPTLPSSRLWRCTLAPFPLLSFPRRVCLRLYPSSPSLASLALTSLQR